jgi:hypothetical protein
MDLLTFQSIDQLTTNTFGISINHYWLIIIGLMLILMLTYIMMIWTHEKEAAPM